VKRKNYTTQLIAIIIVLVLTLIILEVSNITKNSKIPVEKGNINVYFCPEENCKEALLLSISNSTRTLCAFYDFEKNLGNGELTTTKPEILVDEDNYEGYGIKIKSKGLMHNKFCILDKKKVITGSFNPTKDNTNNDNMLIIESEILAQNYLAEYNELKLANNDKTKITTINFNGYLLNNYFCPEDDCKKRILDELKGANESIYFLMFTFTDKDIAKVLSDKKQEGLEVKGVIEKFQNHKISVLDYLNESKVDVQIDSNPKFQHNKVFIIDNKTAITGSYNPTNAANTVNDENILIIRQPDIIERYEKYFYTIFV
jgi:phosphatidylserine/phosphatidylglycerophosphate/cardiolipin synthase-like enzyme